jgi:DNA (cytosine-5)-methyltransferase 1
MYQIVGNGVASRVAWYLGKALAEQLKAAEEIQTAYLQAAAASFPVSFKIKPKGAG